MSDTFTIKNAHEIRWATIPDGLPLHTLTVKGSECSDGYHTFSELYEHRHALFLALCKIYDNYITPLNTRVKCWKSKLHSDGTMFENFFILGMEVRKFDGTTEQITYHLPLRFWNVANVIELPNAPEWDGHTPEDVLQRLMAL